MRHVSHLLDIPHACLEDSALCLLHYLGIAWCNVRWMGEKMLHKLGHILTVTCKMFIKVQNWHGLFCLSFGSLKFMGCTSQDILGMSQLGFAHPIQGYPMMSQLKQMPKFKASLHIPGCLGISQRIPAQVTAGPKCLFTSYRMSWDIPTCPSQDTAQLFQVPRIPSHPRMPSDIPTCHTYSLFQLRRPKYSH